MINYKWGYSDRGCRGSSHSPPGDPKDPLPHKQDSIILNCTWQQLMSKMANPSTHSHGMIPLLDAFLWNSVVS